MRDDVNLFVAAFTRRARERVGQRRGGLARSLDAPRVEKRRDHAPVGVARPVNLNQASARDGRIVVELGKFSLQRFESTVGVLAGLEIVVVAVDKHAPDTVKNFMNYVENG